MLTTLFKRSALLDPESLGHWERDSVREVGIVTGCLLLVPGSLWNRLGGFDETFFMYGEDADLAIRAARLGYRPAITPSAVVTHEVGASSSTRPDKLVLLLRGRATLMRKHWPTGKRGFGLAMLWCGTGLRALIAPVLGRAERSDNAQAWRAVWRARRDWLKGYDQVPAASSLHGLSADENRMESSAIPTERAQGGG
jgi:GT2 family glycosyltransferase